MSKYVALSPYERTELLSRFLIESWSFSKVNTFSRNEKAFEMSYIYNYPFRQSASSVAGSAYHEAVEYYFKSKQKGETKDVVELQSVAFEYINNFPANDWKLQKTTPTIAECVIKATKDCTKLINNFLGEISTYEQDIKEIVDVEMFCSEYLIVNGVEIPLECRAKLDLVVITNEYKLAIIDHKSRAVFTDDKDIKFSIGKQAMTYVLCYEAKTGQTIDEVWFIENKISENRDKSAQLNCFKVILDINTRRLYEAMLYEPLKRMIEAVSDPDYVYLINENDNFVDKAELYEFWAKTMISEIEDFVNVLPQKQELIKQRLKKIRNASIDNVDPNTIKKFRENAAEFIQYDLSNKNMTKEEKIEHTLRTLGIPTQIKHTFDGYSSNTYLMEVSAGTNLSSVQRFKLDIANALDVPNIRMMKDLFVYEDKSYLAIEAAKPKDKILNWDESLCTDGRIPVGYDNFGQVVYWNTNNPSTPHVLVCGSTGSGKSVCLFSIVAYAEKAGFKEIVIFDPKYEFTHRQLPPNTSVYNDIDEIEMVMETMVEEMNHRVKNGISSKKLVIFDEFADAISSMAKGKELNITDIDFFTGKRSVIGKRNSLEENNRVLLQKGRSSGYRFVSATQRASVKVITGDAKVNYPVQICFKVPKDVDSKVVLDESGAESLTGKGDGLIKSPDYMGVVRFQAFYKE